MLHIAIVDDEQEVLDFLYKMVDFYVRERTEDYRIACYRSGVQLLAAAKPLDLLFLDVEMPDMDGIETGKRLRRQNAECKIVMATCNVKRFKESFQIKAFRYVTKPFDKEEIQEAVQEFFNQRIGMEMIEVYHERIPCQIAERDVSYVQAYNGYTYIYAQNRQYRSEESLNYYEEKLDGRIFFKVHRQYMVNLLLVERYIKGKVWVSGQEIKIARARQKEFEAAYMKADILRG